VAFERGKFVSFSIDDDPAASQPTSPAVSAELAADHTPAFSFEDVSWGVGSTQILTRLSESISHGKVTALIGPNGSGKSSLLRILAGVQQPDAGTVEVAGADWLAERPRTKAKTLAYVEQSASADRALTVFDVVLLGRTPHRSVLSRPRALDVEVAVECLELVGMTALKDREFGTLSGGERQRVLIAKALAQQTDILVVDEPTNHLDVAAQLSTLALLRELAAAGKTVLTALHDLNLAATFAHELIVMDRAKFVTSGPPSDVLTEALIRKVYGVDSTVMTNPRTGNPHLVFG
jgi:iron complex transport system ATP-binding protein